MLCSINFINTSIHLHFKNFGLHWIQEMFYQGTVRVVPFLSVIVIILVIVAGPV